MAKKFGNLGKTENLGGISSLISDSTRQEKSKTQPSDKSYVIKTFTIDEGDFEYIKKYVKYKRMQGETEFTQKEALGEAIALLKDKTPNI